MRGVAACQPCADAISGHVRRFTFGGSTAPASLPASGNSTPSPTSTRPTRWTCGRDVVFDRRGPRLVGRSARRHQGPADLTTRRTADDLHLPRHRRRSRRCSVRAGQGPRGGVVPRLVGGGAGLGLARGVRPHARRDAQPGDRAAAPATGRGRRPDRGTAARHHRGAGRRVGDHRRRSSPVRGWIGPRRCCSRLSTMRRVSAGPAGPTRTRRWSCQPAGWRRCTAGTPTDQPLPWINEWGAGRSFCVTRGHDWDAVREVTFMTLLCAASSGR